MMKSLLRGILQLLSKDSLPALSEQLNCMLAMYIGSFICSNSNSFVAPYRQLVKCEKVAL